MRALLVLNGVILAIAFLVSLFAESLTTAINTVLVISLLSTIAWFVIAVIHFTLKYW